MNMTGQGRRLMQALLALALAWLLWTVLDWGVIKAVFHPDADACRAMEHTGACWGVVAEKWPQWVFGRYPPEHRWQAVAALAAWGAALALALAPLWRAPSPSTRLSAAWWAAAACGLLGWGLLAGGWAGLAHVEPRLWGGLPLTLLLAGVSLVASLPLALLLAWGRLSSSTPLSWACTAVIEVVRGAPLVMWLFMAAFVLPAVLPASWNTSAVGRVLLVTTIFSAAYAAEILRGSLQVVAAEQGEAAQVLGARWWTIQSRVVVPQALRTALPALVSHAIGLLKDTALVTIVSLQDLTGAMSVSLNGDPDWRPFFLEAYLVIALIYALMCLGVAAAGRRLEQRFPALGGQQ